MTQAKHKIVIVGAGFAGLMAAVRLSRKDHQNASNITLINASDEYIVRPRLHEWATNLTRERQKIVDMLDGTGVNFVQGWVTELQPEHHAVVVDAKGEQTSILYDSLIVALGSRVNTEAVQGVSEYAYVLDAHDKRGAEQLRQKLLGYQTKNGHVTVIGGGATGIEAATHIKSLNPHLDVTIVTQGALGGFKNDDRVEKSESACRKLFSRAKKHLSDNRPRFETDPKQHQAMLGQFLQAINEGNLDNLVSLLANDAVLVGDGGNKRGAATRPVYGNENIAKFFIGISRFYPELGLEAVVQTINGLPGLVLYQGQTVFSVMSMQIENGKLTRIYLIGNDDKLGHIS